MLEQADIFVLVTVLIACTVLFLISPNWETVQFIITMVVLYCAILWLKEIIEKDGNKKIQN